MKVLKDKVRDNITVAKGNLSLKSTSRRSTQCPASLMRVHHMFSGKRERKSKITLTYTITRCKIYIPTLSTYPRLHDQIGWHDDNGTYLLHSTLPSATKLFSSAEMRAQLYS
jgi:hypothetical protein